MSKLQAGGHQRYNKTGNGEEVNYEVCGSFHEIWLNVKVRVDRGVKVKPYICRREPQNHTGGKASVVGGLWYLP